MMSKEKKNNPHVKPEFVSARNGITLVALVITIIILLILAGITISLTIGQRGILKRAEEAGKNYQEVAGKEDEELRELDNIIMGNSTLDEPKITMVDGVPVPNGFKHIEGTKEDGFVIKDVSVDEEGKPTSTNGNEFVWIPCTEDGKNGSIKYDRYAFSKNGWEFSQTKNEETEEITWSAYGMTYSFTEVMPRIELNSMKQYGGFYIGRYEVGIVDYDTTNIVTSNINNEKEWTGYHNGRAVVQKNVQVWNYITRDMAKKVAEGMYSNNDVVISRLCSSYAWDTILESIEINYLGYATNSTQGNYSGELKNTGQTTAVNHIYDMGGNVSEWTTENCIGENFSCTHRGGNFGNDRNNFPAGIRGCDSETGANNSIGFRCVFYIGK